MKSLKIKNFKTLTQSKNRIDQQQLEQIKGGSIIEEEVGGFIVEDEIGGFIVEDEVQGF